MARPLLLAALLVAFVAALTGCGNRHEEPRTFAEVEGLYLELGGLHYQVQISRQLNPDDTEDGDLLNGIPDTVADPTAEEAWFGVFVRVDNQTDETLPAARRFEIRDAEGNTYSPVPIDPDVNVFAYTPRDLEPGRLIPPLDSAAQNGPIKGGMVLFKMPYSAFQARPLEFVIHPPSGEEGIVDIDV